MDPNFVRAPARLGVQSLPAPEEPSNCGPGTTRGVAEVCFGPSGELVARAGLLPLRCWRGQARRRGSAPRPRVRALSFARTFPNSPPGPNWRGRSASFRAWLRAGGSGEPNPPGRATPSKSTRATVCLPPSVVPGRPWGELFNPSPPGTQHLRFWSLGHRIKLYPYLYQYRY